MTLDSLDSPLREAEAVQDPRSAVRRGDEGSNNEKGSVLEVPTVSVYHASITCGLCQHVVFLFHKIEIIHLNVHRCVHV